ncbi:hypothetical protein V6N13_090965 [Hibiscus sabdariffa]|uniref:CCHC-type domain-containing protein n=1 Tax=Hibiscus sabdariffa TaxID=183260 RepID=A0ABR2R2C5_9ROSI
MRKRFVPQYYYRECKQRLQRLRQGNKSVDEYFQDMEALLQRANIQEGEEDTLARFIVGLNDNISEVLELQPYLDLDEALQKALAIENRLQRKSRFRQREYSPYDKGTSQLSPFQSSNPLLESSRMKPKEEGHKMSKANSKQRSKPTKTPIVAESTQRSSRARDVECFKCRGRGHYARDCPNSRIMFIRDNGAFSFDSEKEQGDVSDEEIIAPYESD